MYLTVGENWGDEGRGGRGGGGKRQVWKGISSNYKNAKIISTVNPPGRGCGQTLTGCCFSFDCVRCFKGSGSWWVWPG